MSILEIFEKVSLVTPIEQRRFFNSFDDTVNELLSMYSGFVIEKDSEYQPLKRVDDICVVLPLYYDAIVDNIIFLSGGGETYKSEFLRKARNAYLKYWNDNAKGRIMKKREW